MRVPLDASQQLRFQRLMDDLVLIDVHQHPMVLSDDAAELPAYFRANAYAWGFDAVKAGRLDGRSHGQPAVLPGQGA